jgi:hypothetical protein
MTKAIWALLIMNECIIQKKVFKVKLKGKPLRGRPRYHADGNKNTGGS